MDSREYKLVEARAQARWVAAIAFLVAIGGWVFFGITLADALGQSASSNAGMLGAMNAVTLAIAVTATVLAGAALVVSWLSSALGPDRRS